MKVLLIGGGGREHAMGWKLAQSPRVDELISIPGNPGLAELGPVIEGIGVTDVGALAAMARIQGIDLVVVGPEAPLAAGIVDALDRLGVPVFGPSRAAAQLESSKRFAKDVMRRAGVPTAESASFQNPTAAKAHIAGRDGPYVVKADGLAAGKGVLVTGSRDEAEAWVDHCLDGGFGAAGESVLIEDYLDGPELSIFAVCTDGGSIPLEPARDYKRLLDQDRGPNTGGMGSYSPVADLPDGLVAEVMAAVVEPTLAQMAEDGHPFRGFLYTGLVLTEDGPRVLEFNVRLGDPETQVVLPRLESDLIDLLEGGRPVWSDSAAVNVVLAAEGYPTDPKKGAQIRGLDQIPGDVLVFHAGSRAEGKRVVVDGGRVLDIVGLGDDLSTARNRAYQAAAGITWPGRQMRSDIAAQS
ncbi:MAG: phosphoribosylamine--glycine ligase [Acidimicrobiia bacterium]